MWEIVPNQSPEEDTALSTDTPFSLSRTSSNSQERITRSVQGTKYIRNTTSPLPERPSILPRANSTGAIKTRSSYYNTAMSVAGVGNSIIRQVSGIVHERQNSNISYAAAVRNNSESDAASMAIRVYDQSKAPKCHSLFEESIDNNGNFVVDVSRLAAGLNFRYFYANCLHIWGLWYQRAKLIKNLPGSILNSNEVTLGIY
jgi:hypothetical protein